MIEYENLHQLNAPFADQYRKAFDETLESGWFILGKKVEEFEKEFASYCKTRHCVGVANGLDALTIALRIFNFERGSEILVPSNTYIATILAVLQNGLKPVLVEPDIQSYNIDPKLIEQHITAKTKAIIPVHLYGKMCEMDTILTLAKKYDLKVIEDCAQAHGAKFKNVTAGNFGHFGAFSFYPTKNLGALADAGAITCNDADLAAQVKSYRNYGSQKKYYNEVIGVNSRLDEIQAAFLLIKLGALDKINEHKRNLAQLYFKHLKTDFIKPIQQSDYLDVFHIYSIRHPKRDKLRAYLLENNIKTEIHYPVSPNKQQALKNILEPIETPISEEIHTTTLSLPISYFHTENDILQVIEKMNLF